MASWLADAGSTFNLEEAAPGRPNVFALGRGTGSGRSLILNAHLDTVGTQEMTDPLVPRIEDGRFYGRSAFDMKAALPPS